jgi:hypothetical protein
MGGLSLPLLFSSKNASIEQQIYSRLWIVGRQQVRIN